MTATDVTSALQLVSSPEKAKTSASFFKTGEGEYGHGDVFLGVTVSEQRKIARQFRELPQAEVTKLLQSEVHECRLTALLIVVDQYRRGDSDKQAQIAEYYLNHLPYVNNWDLVDSSAPYILGDYLLTRDRSVLFTLAKSKNLWERRVAILATFAFIKAGQYDDTLRIAELLLGDTHDLIHKAVGWMLREVGNKSLETAEQFLDRYAATMPRTMLRYAIEKFSESKRQHYLSFSRRSAR